jgi:hypothetical protein
MNHDGRKGAIRILRKAAMTFPVGVAARRYFFFETLPSRAARSIST